MVKSVVKFSLNHIRSMIYCTRTVLYYSRVSKANWRLHSRQLN